MKILVIRIHNLASLEGTTTIDFTTEPLCSAGIFAITGATGAGKSTILDALCLALYAKTPRYLQAKEQGVDIQDIGGNTINQSDARGILRDGTAEGFAEVEFLALDGNRYLAGWKVRRARNSAVGSLQDFTIHLKNLSANTDFPGRKKEILDEIERLAGLNFEQFTRSVLLAQGDFTAFLKANKDEKSSLLEKLTGTHIYSEISKLVFERCRDEKNALDNLNAQRQGIVILTDAELEAYGSETSALNAAIPLQNAEINSLKAEIAWHQKHDDITAGIVQGRADHSAAAEQIAAAADRIRQFKQVEQAEACRSLVDGLRENLRQQALKADELKQTENELEAVSGQIRRHNILLENARTALSTSVLSQQEAVPDLSAARALDVQISEKMSQVTTAEKEHGKAKKQVDDHAKELQQLQGQALELSGKIKTLQTWKTDNSTRQPIAENDKIIISKLKDAAAILATAKQQSAELFKEEEALAAAKTEKSRLEKEAADLGIEYAAEKESWQLKEAALAAVSISELEQERENTEAGLQELVAAEAEWKVLFNTLTDVEGINRSITDNLRAEAERIKSLKDSIEALDLATTRRAVSLGLVEQARLATAENVESLRHTLVDGSPCPVCGATEHPYHINNPQLDALLERLEQNHRQNEAEFAECITRKSMLQGTVDQLAQTIGIRKKELAEKTANLARSTALWTGFAIHRDCAHLDDRQKAGWLGQELEKVRATQRGITGKIKAFQEKKEALDRQKNLMAGLDKKLADNAGCLKDSERSITAAQDNMTRLQNGQQKNSAALLDIQDSLSPFFSSADWMDKWKNDPEAFTVHISSFAGLWNSNKEDLQVHTQQHAVLSGSMEPMERQLASLQKEAADKQSVFDGLNLDLQKLGQKRQEIFKGEAADSVEERLRKAVEDAQLHLGKHQSTADGFEKSLTQLSTQKTHTANDLAGLQKTAAGHTGSINDWLGAYNAQNAGQLDLAQLNHLLELSPDWKAAERDALRAMEDALTKTASVLLERTSVLAMHLAERLSEKTLEQINGLLPGLTETLAAAVSKKTEITFILAEDQRNRSKIQALLEKIANQEKILDRWSKLNDVVGSSDGKKFRQIAQEYTLDVLLVYANFQLETLTKRYQVQRIPNSLGLQVLDQDMGNEVRTVFSLSGGESFLVSLGLALGLASLSTSRMQVESLFIDEGFGSLDINTLNIAMDALDRLQNQGRKVGVISHVQEMTERIPVKINVSKLSNGKSAVEIT